MKRNYYYFSIILSALAIVIFTILAIASKDEVSTAVTTFLAAGIGLGFLIVSILGLKNKSAIKGIILEKIGIFFMGFGVIVLVIGFFSIEMILQAVLISIPACAVGAFCFAKGLNVNGKKAGSTKKADNSSNIAQKYSISNYPELDGIIPAEYRGYINQVIADYNALDDKAFWEKYNLHEIWFTAEEFSQEKAEGRLGFIIVNLLVDKNFILQLDWKEEPADYLNDLRSCWEGKEKIVEFDLDNDQRYLAKVPKEVEMESIYEVKIKDFVVNDEWNTYIEKLCSKMPFLRETLCNGASEDEIKAAEEEMGVQFPGKLKGLYYANDGDNGEAICGMMLGFHFLSLEKMRSEWRRSYADTKLIPFASDGGGNFIGIDLDSNEGGSAGQVISFGRDEQGKTVLAENLCLFFERFARIVCSDDFYIGEYDGEKVIVLGTDDVEEGSYLTDYLKSSDSVNLT